jgi:soluble lytic murein transglycosylase
MRWVTAAWLVAVMVGCAGKMIRPEPDAQRPRQGVSLVEPIPVPQTLTGKRALFANAYRRLRSEEFDPAAQLFAVLLPIYPELEDYVLHYLAICRLRQGDRDEAYRLWSQLQASYPRSLHTAAAALEQARILRQRGDLEAARELLGIAREDELEPEVDWELAEIALAEDDLTEAHRRFMRVREAVPGSSLGRRAKQRIAELRERDPSLTPTGDLRAAEVWLLVIEGDPQAALALAEDLLRQAPEWERPQRLRALSDTQRAAGRFDEGLETLRSVYVDYPDSVAARGALYQYASSLWNQDRDADARRAFEEFRRRYPTDSSIPEVSYAIARIKEAEGKADLAIADYSRLAELYPRRKQGREAGWRVAWIRYRQGRWKEAAESFARLARGSTGQDREGARYWQARSLERTGSRDEARAIYRQILEDDPTDYYAHWAERRLGIQSPALRDVDATVTSRQIGVAPEDTAGDFHLTRARELQAADLRSLARAELKAFERSRQTTETLARFLVDSYPAVDGYRDAIRLAPEAGERSPQILYPLAFWPLIQQRTVSNGIDPLMVLALMRQESLFDPAARSPADARGLMQLLPRTAEQVADRVGQPSPLGDLYEPEVNIALGIAHLEDLHAQYGGNWLEILAAYNGGEGAVAKWKQRFGNLDGDEFVESITYRETRDYVKKVLTHHRRYQQLYAGPGTVAARP